MGRPVGAQNKPGGQKPGPKLGHYNIVEKLTVEEVLEVKQAILQLIEAEEADNITEACEIIGFPKLKAYHYWDKDPLWKNQIKQAQEIKADRLEAKLDKANSPVAAIFRLKGLRPQYRDNYKFDISSEALENLLKELKEVAHKGEQKDVAANGTEQNPKS